MLAKTKPGRSDKYLDYIRSLPCCLCGKTSVPHHTHSGGVGMKGSDFSCIPLCGEHHTELHTIGRATFEERNDIILGCIVAVSLIRWCDLREVEKADEDIS